jgi:acyl-coenzyme A thioesterase PaaI-like protein
VTHVRPLPHWQGWENVLHGGLQATIMDDLMSNHLFQVYQVFAVTAELSLRFKRPVPLDAELRFASRLVRRSGRVWELAAECTTQEMPTAVLSTATGRFLETAAGRPR